ncbi:MAG: caspase family protein [Deltaproteobacteria bacterium]|nr:caspase family protein [Deltaproteobacteria bacterium]
MPVALLLGFSVCAIDLSFIPKNTGHRDDLTIVSASGRWLLLSSFAEGPSPAKNPILRRTQKGIELWDFRAGTPVRYFPTQHWSAALSPDERLLLVDGSLHRLDGTPPPPKQIKRQFSEAIWAIANDAVHYAEGLDVRLFLDDRAVTLPIRMAKHMAFDDASKRLWVMARDTDKNKKTFEIVELDVASATVAARHETEAACLKALASSAEGADLAARTMCGAAGKAMIEEVKLASKTYRDCWQVRGHAAICNFNSELVYYDAAIKREQVIVSPYVSSPLIQQNDAGEWLYVEADGHAVALWDLASMKVKWRSANFSERKTGFADQRLDLLADHKRALMTGNKMAPHLLDLSTFSLTPVFDQGWKRLKRGPDYPSDLCIDAAEHWLAEDLQRCPHQLPDDQVLAGGLRGAACETKLDPARANDFCLVDGAGKTHRVPGHKGKVYDVKYYPATNQLITRALDGTTRIWDWKKKSELAQFVRYENGAVVGRFADGRIVYSPSAEPLLTLSNGSSAAALTTLLGGSLESAGLTELSPQIISRLEALEAAPVITQAPPPVVNDATIKVRLMPRGTNEGWSVRLNGVVLSDKAYTRRSVDSVDELQLQLALGDNFIEVRSKQTRSWPAIVRTTYRPVSVVEYRNAVGSLGKFDDAMKKHAPSLHVVAVGVSSYQDPSLALNYAATDASALARALQAHRRRFAKVLVTEVRDGTKARIEASLAALSKAKPNDMVIVFMAGHGFIGSDDQYYFASSDVSVAAPEKTGVPFSRIEQALSASAARQRLLLLDTCHSGELSAPKVHAVTVAPPLIDRKEEVAVLSQTSTRGIKAKTTTESSSELQRVIAARNLSLDSLRAQSGLVVLASSSANELSYESGAFKRGLFTHALLEVLNRTPYSFHGYSRDIIGVHDVARYVTERVSELSQGQQNPTLRVSHPYYDYPLSDGLEFAR